MPILPVAKLGKSTIKARETRLTKRKIKPLIRNKDKIEIVHFIGGG